MLKVLLVSVAIVIVILVLFVVAITKGYSYKHSVDPLENNPHLDHNDNEDQK
jgi:hypothetical protein